MKFIMGDATDIRTISKKSTEGFKDYLDFDKLRSESIAYLGKLAGKIWTDHNVHDPGITTMEVLCYAILDLGYRTNLPAIDIFTPNPDSKEPENNFFTPAQMLTCNPLTITDFRKLLIDIPGVNNAWLEVATDKDTRDICPGGNDNNGDSTCDRKRTAAEAFNQNAIHYLNGLYHVYADIGHKSTNATEQAEFESSVIKKMRDTLVAHRNICEDFIDITILCEDQMGVCADIEIEPGAEPEKIYLSVIEQLRNYFSPLPKFYTLENLLIEKQKTIDEVFAGRPYGLEESHGFVDTEEFESLKLKKKLHLSDVYSALQQIPGVVRINKLKFRKCDQPNSDFGWEYQLPMNHVPRLDLNCTAVTFTTKGLPVIFDTKQYADLLQLNFIQNGKFLYKAPSPYLDTTIPKGIYRQDLTQYTPIQNEFPKVYGLTQGDLPASASAMRKIQSLQFRGYLLFFDQLLANYLGQLQNIRSLFSFAPAAKNMKRTYYSNQVKMPGLQDLVRFNVDDDSQSAFIGAEGSPLAFPVDKKELLEQIEKGYVNLSKLKPFTFKKMSECKIAVQQLLNDIALDEFKFQYGSNKDECVYYYMLTSSEEFAIVGKRYFGTEADAKRVAETIRYAGLFEENFRSFITPANNFSFSLEMNLSDYPRYLQKILETEDEYLKRRNSFLDHLLLRFAEQFSDYAILAYRTKGKSDEREMEIAHKERFISNYDKLSSNRGKAYNYLKDGWNNGNASGFEKRINALLDVAGTGKQSLCNFEVIELQKSYVFKLKISNELFFTSAQQFSTEEKAVSAAKELVTSLANPDSLYDEPFPDKQGVGIKARYGTKGWETGYFKEGNAIYADKTEAAGVIKRLARAFRTDEYKRSISEDTFKYRAGIKKLNQDEVLYTFKSFDGTAVRALEQGLKNIHETGNADVWNKETQQPGPLSLIAGHTQNDLVYLLDDSILKEPDINNNVDDEPNKHYYTLAAKENAFVLNSVEGYSDPEEAKRQFHIQKTLLVNPFNVTITEPQPGRFVVQLTDNGKPVAQTRDLPEPEATERLKRINNIIAQHTYVMHSLSEGDKWSFVYKLGFEPGDDFKFKSTNDYRNYPDVLDAAEEFYKNPGELDVVGQNNTVELINRNKSISCQLQGDTNDIQRLIKSVEHQINIQKDIRKLIDSDTDAFKKFVELDPVSKAGTYFYRLVDKNNPYAAYREHNADKIQLASIAEHAYDQFADDYNYLELQTGDITISRKDDRNKDWYHYQFQSRNAIRKPDSPNLKKRLVLFESVKAYKTKEEAIEAYKRDFELLLEKGCDASNYGDGQIITLKNIFERNEFKNLFSKTLVRVPKETIDFLGDYDEKSIAQLVNVIKSYPVRSIRVSSEPECFELFVPLKKEEDDCLAPCPASPPKTLYYFILYNKGDSREDWQSVKYYDSASEAMNAFNFFILLMKYKGNYYVDCDCSGKYRVFIREVLAEGTQRFATESEAWGKNGVLNFICVEQSANPFHLHELSKDKKCCYSFDVGCIKLKHLCKYDLPGLRDEALTKMYARWRKYSAGDLVLDGNVIRNADNVQVALINRKPDAKENDRCSYTLEISPGNYNSYKRGTEDDVDCGPDWITGHCYANQKEAFEDFKNNISILLNDITNYKPVFDCTCGSYGIDLYDRIAFNPQCYPSSETACEAVERAKTLTNSEGLHFVEHILLRPDSEKDCRNQIPSCCEEFDECKFVWTDENDDECERKKPVWFLPGYDPYSFIATAVLPAWSQRFRKKENRLMMEDLLRREAPAHVMLRILWLTPFDLCTFERSYRKWVHWLGGKNCGDDFNMYGFIELLFKAGFECLDDDCDACDCCKEKDTGIQNCFSPGSNENKVATQEFREQLDQLYCWAPSTCPRPVYDDTEKNKVFKSRQKRYGDTVTAIENNSQDERVARVRAFIKNPAPTAEKFQDVLSHLLEKPGKAGSGLAANDLRKLTEISVHHYLDSITMNRKKYGAHYDSQFAKLGDAMSHVKSKIPFHSDIYRKWKYEEVVRVNPELNFLNHKHIMA
ncbi:MAG: hypothetical protein JNK79_00425 [Chitinophagaceae bacterium]|nr:hypothetical protein [Chitinophagaceae bacterium]